MTGVPGRVMGIDYGSRRVGIAVSDPLRIVTRGLGVLENGPDLTTAVAARALAEDVVLIVVGMPYAPDGGRGAKGEEVASFIAALRERVRVPVETWDESYSSVLARQAFIDGGMKKQKRKEKSRVDEMAARLLLQEFLESAHHH